MEPKTLTGRFLPGATFKLLAPRTVGLNLAMTLRLESTNPDGSDAQLLGQITEALGLGLGQQTITIPASSPVTFKNQRLKLTICSGVGLDVHLQMDSTLLEATKFCGDAVTRSSSTRIISPR